MAKGVELPDLPYSSETAPGLILAHGNVGDGLTTESPDLYVSSDGGYHWNLALQSNLLAQFFSIFLVFLDFLTILGKPKKVLQ